MVPNVVQLRRIVAERYDKENNTWGVFTLEPDDLGQDEILTLNIAPRKKERSSSVGTTSTPISGTYDSFSASITFLLDTWKSLGVIVGRWNSATYAGADANAGNMIGGGDNVDFCGGSSYVRIIAQGVCDDGSTVDVDLPRCIPSVDDDISIGTTETGTQTLALNPVVYNAKLHADDGYPHYDYRLGDENLETKTRLNIETGEYDEVDGGASA